MQTVSIGIGARSCANETLSVHGGSPREQPVLLAGSPRAADPGVAARRSPVRMLPQQGSPKGGRPLQQPFPGHPVQISGAVPLAGGQARPDSDRSERFPVEFTEHFKAELRAALDALKLSDTRLMGGENTPELMEQSTQSALRLSGLCTQWAIDRQPMLERQPKPEVLRLHTEATDNMNQGCWIAALNDLVRAQALQPLFVDTLKDTWKCASEIFGERSTGRGPVSGQDFLGNLHSGIHEISVAGRELQKSPDDLVCLHKFRSTARRLAEHCKRWWVSLEDQPEPVADRNQRSTEKRAMRFLNEGDAYKALQSFANVLDESPFRKHSVEGVILAAEQFVSDCNERLVEVQLPAFQREFEQRDAQIDTMKCQGMPPNGLLSPSL